MSLTAEQSRYFHEHGFIALPEFFDARETAAIRAGIERLKRAG